MRVHAFALCDLTPRARVLCCTDRPVANTPTDKEINPSLPTKPHVPYLNESQRTNTSLNLLPLFQLFNATLHLMKEETL